MWTVREWYMVIFLVPNYINVIAMEAMSLQAVILDREWLVIRYLFVQFDG